jgi:hypothetical protein
MLIVKCLFLSVSVCPEHLIQSFWSWEKPKYLQQHMKFKEGKKNCKIMKTATLDTDQVAALRGLLFCFG